jgi:hypothetical protein
MAPPTLTLVEIPKRKKAPILHARSAVGYNPVFGGAVAEVLVGTQRVWVITMHM